MLPSLLPAGREHPVLPTANRDGVESVTRGMNDVSLFKSHAALLARIAEIVGEPVQPIALNSASERQLRRDLPVYARFGIAADDPIHSFEGGPRSLSTLYGIECRRIEIDGVPVPVIEVAAPHRDDEPWRLFNFWAVPRSAFRRFYRHLRRLERNEAVAIPPVMPASERDRLWDHTLGFLRRDRTVMRRYGAPLKRGVLLLGEPGNGKTMACRWLMTACQRFGLCWSTVSASDLSDALQSGRAAHLFVLDRPGIILFDDIDRRLLARSDFEGGSDRSTLLTELDGVQARDGVVYLFTSNLPLEDIEPAMKRPGRIDVVLEFSRPDAELRRQFLLERWHPELIAAIDVERIVEVSAGLSFSEIDELRKLLVLELLDTGHCNWRHVWAEFRHSRGLGRDRQKIGFVTPEHRVAVETAFALHAESLNTTEA